MNRSIVSLLLIALLALIMSACVAPAPAAPAVEEEQMEAEEEPMAAEEVEAGSEAEFEQILACVAAACGGCGVGADGVRQCRQHQGRHALGAER